MPKVVIKKDELPPISANDMGYNVRVRLISQDRNRVSFWTPIYNAEAPLTTQIPYGLEINNTTVYINGSPSNKKIVNVFWRDSENNKEYDIYVKWYATNGDPNAYWQYAGTTLSSDFSLIDYNSNHSVQVAVQKPTYPREYDTNYAYFTSIVHSL